MEDKVALGTRRTVTVQTPTGPLAMITPVALALLRQGVISGDVDSGLHAADAVTVKAAVLATSVCDFCSAPGAPHTFDVPDFDMPAGAGLSTDGWAACDACAELVRGAKKDALLRRALDAMAFSRFTQPAIAELHARFWQAMDDKADAAGIIAAFADYASGKLPSPEPERDSRIEDVARIVGLPPSKVRALARGDVSVIDGNMLRKVVAWRDRLGLKGSDVVLDSVLHALGHAAPPLRVVQPHWQTALDMKFEAVRRLSSADALFDDDGREAWFTPDAVDLNDPQAVRGLLRKVEAARDPVIKSLALDARALRDAETYSFSGETAAAIQLAAASIPRETPLSALDLPGGGRSGWFWFAAPLQVKVSPASDVVHALLWYWDQKPGKKPFLRLSSFSLGNVVVGQAPLPGNGWSWALDERMDAMIARCRAESVSDEAQWTNTKYGPGLGPDVVAASVEALSLFFAAACMWMQQRILVSEAGHVERHAKKRYVREHKLAEPPAVRVIALRKSYREPSGEASHGEPGSRQYHCRWIVKGHPRLQAVGPGRTERKLIWIAPHPAGPADKPLKLSKRVYAVVR